MAATGKGKKEKEQEKGTVTLSATTIIWNKNEKRFETEDKLAYLQYNLTENNKAIDIIHTYVPYTKRGLGLAQQLCVSAFIHAKQHSLFVIPSCSYVSDTFLPRNASWASIVYTKDCKSNI